MRRNAFSGLFLILLGVIFLLSNFGYLPGNFWYMVMRFWPLILVVLGVRILFRNNSKQKTR